MAQYTWTMYNNQELPAFVLDAIKDETGTAYDFSSGWTFAVRLCRANAKTTTLLLKTAGITGSSAGVVTIAWATTDWDGLAADTNGTQYVVYLTAARTSDGKTVDYKPSNPPTLLLKAAPGTSAVAPGNVTVTVDADTVTVTDAGGYYTSTEVEGALQEVGATTAAAKMSPGLRWAFFGDSIVNGSSASNFSYSLVAQSLYMTGGTVARVDSIEAGTSGDTSALLAARVATTLATYSDVAGSVVMIGANDASTPVAASTYATNISAIVRLLRRRGPVVLCTVTPRSSSATAAQRNAIYAYNTWIKTYAYALGCEIADTWSAIVDTTTGYLSGSYDSGDGIHPNDLGHHLMAVEVAKAMKRATARSVPNSLVTGVLDTTALLTTDPLATNATNIRPSSWFEQPGGTGTAPTYSLVSDTSSVLPVGRWAQMDFDGSASGGTRRLAAGINSNWAVGDILALFGYVQVEDVSGSWRANVVGGTESVIAQIVNQSGSAISGGQPYTRCVGVPSSTSGVYDIGPVWWPFVVPSGTTSMTVWWSVTVPTGQRVKARIGNCGVVNLTTLGLASSIGAWANTTVNT